MNDTPTPAAAGEPPFAMPVPDAVAGLRAWTEWQAQSGERSTHAVREALCACLQLAGQGATTAREWLDAASQSATRLSGIANAAAERASGAADARALWDAEIEWFNQATQAAAGSMHQAFGTVAENQALLLQEWLERSDRALRQWLQACTGSLAAPPTRLDPASEAPVLAVEGPWFDWMRQATEASRSYWTEFAAHASGTGSPGDDAQPGDAPAPNGSGRAHKQGHHDAAPKRHRRLAPTRRDPGNRR